MTRHTDRSERGQVLVIVAAGMVALIAMVGLVIDGGHAWGRQRKTQNGADSVAMAGTGVVQHHLALVGSPTDGDVGCAVEGAALANDVDLETAEYTDFQGNTLSIQVGGCGAGGVIPLGAQGVKATATQTFGTFLMGVVGFGDLTARADATAVVGPAGAMCPADQGCAALPVTFPQTTFTCDSLETEIEITAGDGLPWEPYELVPDGVALDSTNLAIVPLCDTAAGSVGWLDYGCGNLDAQISNPCNEWIDIPDWLQTHTGNINCCQGQLNAYTGTTVGLAEDADKVLSIPIHNNTCDTDPSPPYTPICPSGEWSGQGNNLNYHVPFWVGFKLDAAYTQGGDTECQTGLGQPLLVNPMPAGKVGCLKGWFVEMYEAPGPISIGPISQGDPVAMGLLLIH